MGLLDDLDAPQRAAAVAARMKTLDHNADGKITWEEFKARAWRGGRARVMGVGGHL